MMKCTLHQIHSHFYDIIIYLHIKLNKLYYRKENNRNEIIDKIVEHFCFIVINQVLIIGYYCATMTIV